MKFLLSLLTLVLATFVVAKPVEFTAHYRAYSAGVPCGQGTISLQHIDGDQYQYQAEGKACVLSQKLKHRSRFNLEPLTGIEYETKFSGWFSKRELVGNHRLGRFAVTLDQQPLSTDEFPPAVMEPTILMHQLGHSYQSQQLSYTWGEETRDYWFEYLGTELIDTKLGLIEAHKYLQDHPNESRNATLWFSPAHDGLLVKANVSRLGVPWLSFAISEYHPQ